MYRIDNATSALALPTPQPVGINPNGFFQSNTIVDADWANNIQEEPANLVIGSGQALLKTDNQQVHKAVSHYSAGGDFYIDSGVANAYVLSVAGAHVAPPAYFTGMRIRFVAGSANTGPSTVTIGALPTVALVSDIGAALSAGDVPLGAQTTAYYSAGQFRVLCASRNPMGALSYKSANQSIGSAADTVATFDTELYDNYSIHNNVTNNDRLTVPAGVTVVRLRAIAVFALNATGYRRTNFVKNTDSLTASPPGTRETFMGANDGTNAVSLVIDSGLLSVVGGDYFRLVVFQASGNVLNLLSGVNATMFSMEIVR